MDIVLQMKSENLNKVKDLLLKDETVNRASIMFKDGKDFEIEGYVCYVSGTEEHCKQALNLVKVKDEAGEVKEVLAKEVSPEEKEKIINKIKEEEDRAIEGFGGIFG